MSDKMIIEEQYASYLVRLWRSAELEVSDTGWLGEIEHIQSGRRWRFETLEELLAIFDQEIRGLKASIQPPTTDGFRQNEPIRGGAQDAFFE
jgi:hypothetical protein